MEAYRKQWKPYRCERFCQCLAWGGFVLILLYLQRFLQTGWGDDLWFARQAEPLGAYLAGRYQEWTSRLFVEAGERLLTAAPDWIWRTLNLLMVLLLVWIVADLFGIPQKGTKLQSQIILFTLIWFVPMETVKDAGWISTTLNNLWPLALGLVALRPIRHLLAGEQCPKWEYFACPPCLLYGANAELCGALLLASYLAFGAYLFLSKKRLSPFYLLLTLMAAASVAFALTAPGNAIRAAAETVTWFPAFADLGVWEKLLMGWIDTGTYYLALGGIAKYNYLFALLAGILQACLWRRRKERWFACRICIALVPFLFCCMVGLLRRRHYEGYFFNLLARNHCLPIGAGYYGFFGRSPYPMPMVLLQACVYLAIAACVGLTIYFLHGRSHETLLELYLLGAGLSSRLIVGFSPTYYASGQRTALYCSAAILIVCLRNLQLSMGAEHPSGGSVPSQESTGHKI